MTVAELIAALAEYPGHLDVRLFTFNLPDLPAGWWAEHPVDPESFEWVDGTLRICAQD